MNDTSFVVWLLFIILHVDVVVPTRTSTSDLWWSGKMWRVPLAAWGALHLMRKAATDRCCGCGWLSNAYLTHPLSADDGDVKHWNVVVRLRLVVTSCCWAACCQLLFLSCCCRLLSLNCWLSTVVAELLVVNWLSLSCCCRPLPLSCCCRPLPLSCCCRLLSLSCCCRLLSLSCWLSTVVAELLAVNCCRWTAGCRLVVSELLVVDWLSLSCCCRLLSLSCCCRLLSLNCCCRLLSLSWLLSTDAAELAVVNWCCWTACYQLMLLNWLLLNWCCWTACCQLMLLSCLLSTDAAELPVVDWCCWTACCQSMLLNWLLSTDAAELPVVNWCCWIGCCQLDAAELPVVNWCCWSCLLSTVVALLLIEVVAVDVTLLNANILSFFKSTTEVKSGTLQGAFWNSPRSLPPAQVLDKRSGPWACTISSQVLGCGSGTVWHAHGESKFFQHRISDPVMRILLSFSLPSPPLPAQAMCFTKPPATFSWALKTTLSGRGKRVTAQELRNVLEKWHTTIRSPILGWGDVKLLGMAELSWRSNTCVSNMLEPHVHLLAGLAEPACSCLPSLAKQLWRGWWYVVPYFTRVVLVGVARGYPLQSAL